MENHFKKFLRFCDKHLDNKKELLQLVKKRYNECDINYKLSDDFAELLSLTEAKILSDGKRFFVHLKDFLDVLKDKKGKREVTPPCKRFLASDSSSENEHPAKRAKNDISLNGGVKSKTKKLRHLKELITDSDTSESELESSDKIINTNGWLKDREQGNNSIKKHIENRSCSIDDIFEDTDDELKALVDDRVRKDRDRSLSSSPDLPILDSLSTKKTVEKEISSSVKHSVDIVDIQSEDGETVSRQTSAAEDTDSDAVSSVQALDNEKLETSIKDMGTNDVSDEESKSLPQNNVSEIFEEKKNIKEDYVNDACEALTDKKSAEMEITVSDDEDEDLPTTERKIEGVSKTEYDITDDSDRDAGYSDNNQDFTQYKDEKNYVDKIDQNNVDKGGVKSAKKDASSSDDDSDSDSDGDKKSKKNRDRWKKKCVTSCGKKNKAKRSIEFNSGKSKKSGVGENIPNSKRKSKSPCKSKDGKKSPDKKKKSPMKSKSPVITIITDSDTSSGKEDVEPDHLVNGLADEVLRKKGDINVDLVVLVNKCVMERNRKVKIKDTEEKVDSESENDNKDNNFPEIETYNDVDDVSDIFKNHGSPIDSLEEETDCKREPEPISDTDVVEKENYHKTVKTVKTSPPGDTLKKRVPLITEELFDHSKKSGKEKKHKDTQDRKYFEDKKISDKHKKDLGGSSERPGTSAQSDSETGTKRKGSSKQVKKLELLLEQIRDQIERVRSRELDLNDLDSEISDYILEDKLQKKFVKVWNKLCELQNSASTTGRHVERYFKYEGTRYPAINKKIEKFINRKKIFPDYHDIRNLIMVVNSDKRLHLRSNAIDDLAREAFTDVGNKLQLRRQKDFIDTLNASDNVNVHSIYDDPALYDPNLKKKLETNKKVAKSKMQQVVEKYARLQYQDGDKTEDDDDDDEEEEEAAMEEENEKMEVDNLLEQLGVDSSDCDGDDERDMKIKEQCIGLGILEDYRRSKFKEERRDKDDGQDPHKEKKTNEIEDTKEKHFIESLGLGMVKKKRMVSDTEDEGEGNSKEKREFGHRSKVIRIDTDSENEESDSNAGIIDPKKISKCESFKSSQSITIVTDDEDEEEQNTSGETLDLKILSPRHISTEGYEELDKIEEVSNGGRCRGLEDDDVVIVEDIQELSEKVTEKCLFPKTKGSGSVQSSFTEGMEEKGKEEDICSDNQGMLRDCHSKSPETSTKLSPTLNKKQSENLAHNLGKLINCISKSNAKPKHHNDNDSTKLSNETTEQNNDTVKQNNETTKQNNDTSKQGNDITKHNEKQQLNNDTAEHNKTTKLNNDTTEHNNEATKLNNATTECNTETTKQTNYTTKHNTETTKLNIETTKHNYETTEQNNATTEHNNEATKLNNATTRCNTETTKQNNDTTKHSTETTKQTNDTTKHNTETTKLNNDTTKQNNDFDQTNQNTVIETTNLISDTDIGSHNIDTIQQNIETTNHNSDIDKIEQNIGIDIPEQDSDTDANTQNISIDITEQHDSIDMIEQDTGIKPMEQNKDVDTTNRNTDIDATKQDTGTDTTNQIIGTDTTNQINGTDTTNQIIGTDTTNQIIGNGATVQDTDIDMTKQETGSDATKPKSGFDNTKHTNNVETTIDLSDDEPDIAIETDVIIIEESPKPETVVKKQNFAKDAKGGYMNDSIKRELFHGLSKHYSLEKDFPQIKALGIENRNTLGYNMTKPFDVKKQRPEVNKQCEVQNQNSKIKLLGKDVNKKFDKDIVANSDVIVIEENPPVSASTGKPDIGIIKSISKNITNNVNDPYTCHFRKEGMTNHSLWKVTNQNDLPKKAFTWGKSQVISTNLGQHGYNIPKNTGQTINNIRDNIKKEPTKKENKFPTDVEVINIVDDEQTDAEKITCQEATSSLAVVKMSSVKKEKAIIDVKGKTKSDKSDKKVESIEVILLDDDLPTNMKELDESGGIRSNSLSDITSSNNEKLSKDDPHLVLTETNTCREVFLGVVSETDSDKTKDSSSIIQHAKASENSTCTEQSIKGMASAELSEDSNNCEQLPNLESNKIAINNEKTSESLSQSELNEKTVDEMGSSICGNSEEICETLNSDITMLSLDSQFLTDSLTEEEEKFNIANSNENLGKSDETQNLHEKNEILTKNLNKQSEILTGNLQKCNNKPIFLQEPVGNNGSVSDTAVIEPNNETSGASETLSKKFSNDIRKGESCITTNNTDTIISLPEHCENSEKSLENVVTVDNTREKQSDEYIPETKENTENSSCIPDIDTNTENESEINTLFDDNGPETVPGVDCEYLTIKILPMKGENVSKEINEKENMPEVVATKMVIPQDIGNTKSIPTTISNNTINNESNIKNNETNQSGVSREFSVTSDTGAQINSQAEKNELKLGKDKCAIKNIITENVQSENEHVTSNTKTKTHGSVISNSDYDAEIALPEIDHSNIAASKDVENLFKVLNKDKTSAVNSDISKVDFVDSESRSMSDIFEDGCNNEINMKGEEIEDANTLINGDNVLNQSDDDILGESDNNDLCESDDNVLDENDDDILYDREDNLLDDVETIDDDVVDDNNIANLDEEEMTTTSLDSDLIPCAKVKLPLPDVRNKLLKLEMAMTNFTPLGNTKIKTKQNIAKSKTECVWNEVDENAGLIESYTEPETVECIVLEEGPVMSSVEDAVIVLSDSE